MERTEWKICLLFERIKTPPKIVLLFQVSTLGGAYQGGFSDYSAKYAS